MRRSITLLALLLLAGCAGEQAMRGTSGQAAALLAQYRSGLTDFAAEQSTLNDADRAELRRLRDITAVDQSEVDTRLLGWRIAGNKTAIATFETLTAVDADQLLAIGGSINKAAETTDPPLKYATAPVDAVIKRLLDLSKAPSFIDRAREAIAFTSALRKSYDEAIAKATADTSAATDATTQAADAAVDATGK